MPPAPYKRASGNRPIFCTRCDYNLTGLVEPRCPECGAAYDPDAAFDAALCPRGPAFELAHGWRSIDALGRTALTVVFAPWVFARQIHAKSSLVHALIFLAVCIAGMFLSIPFMENSA